MESANRLTLKSGIVLYLNRLPTDYVPRAIEVHTVLGDGTPAMAEGLRRYARDTRAFLSHTTDQLPHMIPRPELTGFEGSAGGLEIFGSETNKPKRRWALLMQGLKAGVRGWGLPSGEAFFAFYRLSEAQWATFCEIMLLNAVDPVGTRPPGLEVFFETGDASMFALPIGA